MHLPRVDTRRGRKRERRGHGEETTRWSVRQSPPGGREGEEVALQVSWEITLRFPRRDLFFRSRCHAPRRQLLHCETPRHVLARVRDVGILRPLGRAILPSTSSLIHPSRSSFNYLEFFSRAVRRLSDVAGRASVKIFI